MLPHFALQAGQACVAVFIIANIVNATKNTPFHYKTPTILQQGFVYAKGVFTLKVIALWLWLSLPFYILFYAPQGLGEIFITLTGGLAITTLAISPELSLTEDAKLVITKPLLSRTATLHLRTPYQDFDIQTYRELFTLVEYLPQYGIKTITLNSPMFYDTHGKLRNLNSLEKGLNKRRARLSHAPIGRFDCLLGKISMLLSRDKRKRSSHRTANRQKWHKIVITL